MTHVAEVIEIVGNSEKDWTDAAQVALDEAKKTIHGITGLAFVVSLFFMPLAEHW